ncbi:unnamed protein product [Cyprideis torosa]|nr:unnamed protein product [Cyprideis torosa]CAG0901935.1 unnamed protein product [Cyprideis torosa]
MMGSGSSRNMDDGATCSRGWNDSEHYREHWEAGVYTCVECGNELFNSKSKFKHDTPWPAFSSTVTPNCVMKKPEPDCPTALKLLCAECTAPLGHEFLKEGPDGVAVHIEAS